MELERIMLGVSLRDKISNYTIRCNIRHRKNHHPKMELGRPRSEIRWRQMDNENLRMETSNTNLQQERRYARWTADLKRITTKQN